MKRLSSSMRVAAHHTHRRVVLCADFDQTLTARDTIALLFQRAADRQSSPHARAAHTAHVQRLVQQYMSDLQTLVPGRSSHSSSVSTTASQTTGVGDAAAPLRFDASGLSEYLDSFAAVDLQSIQRVTDARLLQGIHNEDLVASAAQIEFMPACLDALASADAAYAVSSNWSAVMLDAALNGVSAAADDADPARRPIEIITNDLEVDAAGVTTGAIQLRVQSPRDKAHCVQQIRTTESRKLGDDVSDDDVTPPLIVFVGDSANDLLAMLAADVGVALTLGANSSFVQLAQRYGVTLEPLSERASLVECAAVSHAVTARGERVLFTAANWMAIRRAMH